MTKSSMLAWSNSMRPCTRSSNVVSPSGTRKRIARGAPAASRAATSAARERAARAVVHPGAARGFARPRVWPSDRPACSSSDTRGRSRPARAAAARYLSSRSVWKYGACGPPTPGPSSHVESEPPHAVENAGDHVGRRALDVGVFDAEDERAAVPAGVEPVEQRRARAADVEIAGRRRRETDAGAHHSILLAYGARRIS